MIIRFRTKEGTFRVTVDKDQPFKVAFTELSKQVKSLDTSFSLISTNPSGGNRSVEDILDKTLEELKLKHGDMLYVTVPTAISENDGERLPAAEAVPVLTEHKQLAIDDKLDNDKGLIPRKRSTFCRHSDLGMCEYCSPLPPWDLTYLQENGIKHKSFHAHLNELNHVTNKSTGGSYIPPLKEPSFAVAKNCTGGHKPWPAGICSKCQPSAITLTPQDFRMIDHVEFASSEIINTFIDSWRHTGYQRLGYLYGKYQEYPRAPLGIKAVVEAIYEPPQQDEIDGISLTLPWEDEEQVDKVAESLGLVKLGAIFTDLTDSGFGDGSVLCKRHKDSFFLSSLETIFAAQQQIKYPNYSKHSITGEYSSKFVTCVVSGNLKLEIEVSSYQVSAAAEALVKADLISGSTHPSMVYINEKTDTRYVPDIFYKKTNQYGIVVKHNAKPSFPDDYLLVTLTYGSPQNPNPTFVSPKKFPLENRQFLGVNQSVQLISSHLNLTKRYDDNSINELVKLLSDFHLLAYLFSLSILSAQEEKLVAHIATSLDVNACFELLETPGWKSLVAIVRS